MKRVCSFLILLFGVSQAYEEKPSVADIVNEVAPSVVMVRAEKSSEEYQPGILIIRKDCRIGSGFIVDEKGYILTSSHIIGDYNTIQVELKSGEEYNAQIVKIDKKSDAALLKIDAKTQLSSVRMGNPRQVRPGDPIIIIGNPLPQELGLPPKSFKPSVACGVIGSTERLSYENKKLFQLSLPVNFGNSGGPLLNASGEVIGLVNSKITGFSGHTLEGIGFAISIEELRGMLNLFVKRRESISHPLLPLKKNRESIFLLITELLLVLMLTIRISQRREKDYRFIKRNLYKAVYKGDYYGYCKILQGIFKNCKRGLVDYFPLLVSDTLILQSKEPWLLPELNRQLEDLIEGLPCLDEQRKAMRYRARLKRGFGNCNSLANFRKD